MTNPFDPSLPAMRSTLPSTAGGSHNFDLQSALAQINANPYSSGWGDLPSANPLANSAYRAALDNGVKPSSYYWSPTTGGTPGQGAPGYWIEPTYGTGGGPLSTGGDPSAISGYNVAQAKWTPDGRPGIYPGTGYDSYDPTGKYLNSGTYTNVDPRDLSNQQAMIAAAMMAGPFAAAIGGAGAAGAVGGAAGGGGSGAVGAGMVGDSTAAGYGGLSAGDAATMGGGYSVAGGAPLGDLAAGAGAAGGAAGAAFNPAADSQLASSQLGITGDQAALDAANTAIPSVTVNGAPNSLWNSLFPNSGPDSVGSSWQNIGQSMLKSGGNNLAKMLAGGTTGGGGGGGGVSLPQAMRPPSTVSPSPGFYSIASQPKSPYYLGLMGGING